MGAAVGGIVLGGGDADVVSSGAAASRCVSFLISPTR